VKGGAVRRVLLAVSVVVLVAGVVVVSTDRGDDRGGVTASDTAPPGQGVEAGSVDGRWVIRDLGTLRWKKSVAVAINERGQVIGVNLGPLHKHPGHMDRHQMSRAFLWERGRMWDLGTLGGPESEAAAINDRGQVVGAADTARRSPETGFVVHAFVWQEGRMRDLGTLGGLESMAFALNGRGEVVGWAETSTGPGDWECTIAQDDPWDISTGARHPFLWRSGKMRDLGTFGGEEGYASGINAAGQVIGEAHDSDCSPHAFLWSNGTKQDLAVKAWFSAPFAINNRGQVVGYEASGDVGFLWEQGRLRDLPLPNGLPTDINDEGQIIGWDTLWEDGQITELGIDANDLNDNGQVIGTLEPDGTSPRARPRAALWENGEVTDLGTLPGGAKSEAVAINNNGQIVGWATTKTGKTHAVLWTKTG
jgi:probable HAF family extracellular repeat protein